MDVTATLNQAIMAAKAGHKEEARHLLESVLDADERNEQAWLWLSGVIEDKEERVICLENVLVINPQNETARKELAALRAAPLAKPPSPPGAPEGSFEGSPIAEGLQSPKPGIAPRTGSIAQDAPAGRLPATDSRIFIVITIVLALMLICTVVSILAFVILSPAG